MGRLSPNTDPNLLVDASSGDDAAVYLIDDGRALVVTADFITPLVDDAFTWGRIAAANSVSDVYAMGGRPLLALNLVGWNVDELSSDLLGEVLAGAEAVARDGGFVIAGGHTVDDPEPKFGLAVVGEVDPARMLLNTGFRPGQAIVLTKPLGIGIVSTALKRGHPDVPLDAAIVEMTRLNAEAAEAAVAAGATGGTDVTGFGLLGHLGRAAIESAVDVEIEVDSVPVLPGVRDLAEAGFVPGGSERNLAHAEPQLDGSVADLDALLLADAQTSGGLVFGVDLEAAAGLVDRLAASGHTAAVIGRTVPAPGSGRLRLL